MIKKQTSKDKTSSQRLLLEPIKFHIQLLHPKYIGLWIILSIARLLGLLPFKTKLKLGHNLGNLLYVLVKKRRNISYINLKNAFPDKNEQEIEDINRQHFQSLGIGLMETIFVWWGNYRKPEQVKKALKMVSYHGLEHLQKAQKKGKGVLMLSHHTTHTDMVGTLIFLITDFHPLYRPYDNLVMEYLNRKARTQLDDKVNDVSPILYKNTREIIRSLKAGGNFFYLPDQKYISKGSMSVPFFNNLAPTNTGMSKLVKITGCEVVPFFTKRDENGHYHVTFKPALQDFPSDDTYTDILRLHKLYEAEIQNNIPQYLWVHNRWDIQDKKIFSDT